MAHLETQLGQPVTDDSILWVFPIFGLIFLTPACVAGAFGWKSPSMRYGPLLPHMPRQRWKVAGVFAVLMAASLLLAAANTASSGHSFTGNEVVWVRGNRIVERDLIAQAYEANLYCEKGDHRHPRPSISFNLFFHHGRELSLGDDRWSDGLSGWLDQVEPVMATLRAAHADNPKALRLAVSPKPDCYGWFSGEVPPETYRRLEALFAPAAP